MTIGAQSARARPPPESWDREYELSLEPGFDPAEVAKLAAMGHRVNVAPGNLGSRIQLIRRDPATGVLFGGSDPRAEGMAAGY